MTPPSRQVTSGISRRTFLATTAGVGALTAAATFAQSGGAPAAASAERDKRDTISRVLSRYAVQLRYEDLSPDVLRYSKHLLLDTLGVALGAFAGEPSRIARAVVRELGGRPEATMIGTGEKTSASLAALANGAMVRYLDFMDIYFNVDNPHPSENIPVALAMAERQRRSGKDLLLAMFLGFEIQGRFADTWALPKVGFHNVTMGGYVTPIVAGRLLGLTEDQMVNAVGLGGATSHTSNYLGDQVTMIKALGYGFTGQRGVEAALLAEKGLTGPADVVETLAGLIKFSGDLTPLTSGGDTPRILHTAIKPFAAEYMTHGPLEALFAIRAEHPLRAAEIATMTLRTFSTAIDVLAKPGAYRPQTRETADHSLPYCLAIGVVEGALGPEQFERRQWEQPEVIALMSRITIVEDASMTRLYPRARPAELEIRTTDGRVYRHRVDYPKGDPRNPMSDQEVKAKFRSLVAPLMNEARIRSIIDLVDHVETLPDVRRLARLLVVSDAHKG